MAHHPSAIPCNHLQVPATTRNAAVAAKILPPRPCPPTALFAVPPSTLGLCPCAPASIPPHLAARPNGLILNPKRLLPVLPLTAIMFFFFVCGEHTFRKEVRGYEGMVCQCLHCGNMAAHVTKSNPWFTFCWIPVIPLSISGYTDVACRICNFHQPLESRPDVKAMANGGGGGGYPPPHGAYQGPPPQQGPPQGGHPPMRYG